MTNLEARLRAIPESVNESFVAEASKPKISPREMYEKRLLPRLKDDLVVRMGNHLRNHGSMYPHEFTQKIYSSFNRKPLNKAYYGMFTTPNIIPRDIPKEVLEGLQGAFEPVYLYAGMWYGTFMDKNEPVALNVARALKAGVDCISRNHEYHKEKGKYSSEARIPERKEIDEAFYALRERHDGKSQKILPAIKPALIQHEFQF